MPFSAYRRSSRLRLFLLGALVLPSLLACVSPTVEPPPRHLILVVFDTLRADRMSIYGYDRPTTPFLDSLAGELVRFASAKAPAPWTLPSHASLFTGLWPTEHRVHWGNKWLDDDFETLAETLQGAGFCTFGLTANPIVSDKTGLDQGFDTYKRIPKPTTTQTERLMARIPDLLDRAAERDCRLFLFINVMSAHTPFDVAEFGSAFGVDSEDPIMGPRPKWEIAAGIRPFPENERLLHLAAYDAAVRSIDATTEKLVDLLRRRDLLEKTLLVLTSDHGEGLGSHRELGHVISVWEEQLAVPLLVRFPSARRGGAVVEQTTSLVRLAPSVLDWLAVARPPALASAPTLESDQVVAADYRSYFDPSFTANLPMKKRYPTLVEQVHHTHVTYCPPYKLLMYADRKAQLFDVASDPAELTNLAQERPGVLRTCVTTYRALAREGRFMPFELDLETGELDAVDDEALRSLGYLQ
jgi:arylsulfatase A-like enzyme